MPYVSQQDLIFEKAKEAATRLYDEEYNKEAHNACILCFCGGASLAIKLLEPVWTVVTSSITLPQNNKSYWVEDKEGNVTVKEGFSMTLNNTSRYTPVIKPVPPSA